jgi:hypothetical protein
MELIAAAGIGLLVVLLVASVIWRRRTSTPSEVVAFQPTGTLPPASKLDRLLAGQPEEPAAPRRLRIPWWALVGLLLLASAIAFFAGVTWLPALILVGVPVLIVLAVAARELGAELWGWYWEEFGRNFAGSPTPRRNARSVVAVLAIVVIIPILALGALLAAGARRPLRLG